MKRFFTAFLLTSSLWAQPAPQQGGTITFSAGQPRTGKMSYKLVMEPGQVHQDRIKVGNQNDFPLDFRVYNTHSETGPNGQISSPLFGEPVKEAGQWLTLEKNALTLDGGGQDELGFSVTVPKDTKPGEYIAFIMVEPTPESVDRQSPPQSQAGEREASFRLRINSRFALAVVVRVPGQLDNAIRLGELSKTVTDDGQLVLRVGLENLGNTYFKPNGRWSLRGPDGQILRQDDRRIWGIMLPGSKCQHEIPVDDAKSDKPQRPLVRGTYLVEVDVTAQPDQELKPTLKGETLKRTYEISLP
ncbi:hypothetical protein JST97_13580 [bacterium]|nr:hypothetical protein [bacterium]